MRTGVNGDEGMIKTTEGMKMEKGKGKAVESVGGMGKELGKGKGKGKEPARRTVGLRGKKAAISLVS